MPARSLYSWTRRNCQSCTQAAAPGCTLEVTQTSSREIFASFNTLWMAPPTAVWLSYLLAGAQSPK
jgi:hypothetical protein